MSKSISVFVFDTPENCDECRLCYKDNFDDDSWFTYRCTESEDKVDYDGIYENCPLKPLPKYVKDKNTFAVENKYMNYQDGYNACIDQILGE